MTSAPEHIVKAFDDELKRLREAIVRMGGLSEAQLAREVTRDSGEVQVTSRSPTPASPRKVNGFAPWDTANRLISARLRVMSMPMVFWPTSRPPAMPQTMA